MIRHRAGTGYGFAAAWIAPPGFGAGSGLMQALRRLGGAIGVPVLGTVHGSGYRSRAL